MVVLHIDTSLRLETPGGFHGGSLQRHRPGAGDSWQFAMLCSSLTPAWGWRLLAARASLSDVGVCGFRGSYAGTLRRSCIFTVVLNIDTSLGLETPGCFHGGFLQRHRPGAGDSCSLSLLLSMGFALWMHAADGIHTVASRWTATVQRCLSGEAVAGPSSYTYPVVRVALHLHYSYPFLSFLSHIRVHQDKALMMCSEFQAIVHEQKNKGPEPKCTQSCAGYRCSNTCVCKEHHNMSACQKNQTCTCILYITRQICILLQYDIILFRI